jgi:hypothetical protein
MPTAVGYEPTAGLVLCNIQKEWQNPKIAIVKDKAFAKKEKCKRLCNR